MFFLQIIVRVPQVLTVRPFMCTITSMKAIEICLRSDRDRIVEVVRSVYVKQLKDKLCVTRYMWR